MNQVQACRQLGWYSDQAAALIYKGLRQGPSAIVVHPEMSQCFVP